MNTIISQALATGLPVITTKHSGLPDQVKDGKNGFLVSEGDYHALAEAIIRYLEHPELWGPMGEFGRQHVLQNYDSKKLIDEQLQIYSDCLR